MAYFIFDLDGTLLNDEFEVPKKNWVFLQQLKNSGHKLAIATGRPYESMVDKIKDPTFFDALISYNGAKINIDNQLIEYPMPVNIIEEFIKKYNHENWVIAISMGNKLYTDRPLEIPTLLKALKPQVFPLSELPIIKTVYILRLVSTKPSHHQNDYHEIKALSMIDGYNVISTANIYTLISNNKADKLKAINLLQKQSGEKCFFFGDSHNDLDVFMAQHQNLIGVAPTNAIPEIKKIAKIVLKTTNNDSLTFDFKKYLD